MPKQITASFPIRKRSGKRKIGAVNKENNTIVGEINFTDNQDVDENTPSPVRKLFDSPPSKKSKLHNGSKSCGTPGKVNKCSFSLQLQRVDISPVVNAKQVFHTSMPSRLVGRDREISQISEFITEHLNSKKPGSLYISGAPGTGKTSSLMHILNSSKEIFQSIFINCMSVTNSNMVYKKIAIELGLVSNLPPSKIVKKIEERITLSEKVIVLVLDEIDQLDSKGQDVLYRLFEWPQLPNSSLVLVGIANALDLTDRILPRLHAFKCQPKLLHFQPYSRDQIVAILEDRLAKLQSVGSSAIIQPAAIQLCARKIAACTGDIRKALEVCRRAIEMVENETRRQLVLKHTSDDRSNPGSPKKYTPPSTFKQVNLQQINVVLNQIYGSRIQSSGTSNSETITLPLQQKILLCTLYLVVKNCKRVEFTLGRLYEVYRRVCKKRQMEVVNQSEFHSICDLMESRGILELKNSKVAKMTKFILKIDEGEIQHFLQDKTLLSSILSDTSVVQPTR